MILFKEEGVFGEGALVLVDKPLKWTSFDVVNKIRWCLRKKYGKLKVGHAGTLDPLATGLVIICIGKWTKEIERYMGQQKEYLARICLGATTLPSIWRQKSMQIILGSILPGNLLKKYFYNSWGKFSRSPLCILLCG